MTQPIRFLRSCPSCSKKLQISVQLLGKEVVCNSCGCQFAAIVGGSGANHGSNSFADEIDQRVAELIQAADRQLGRLQNLVN